MNKITRCTVPLRSIVVSLFLVLVANTAVAQLPAAGDRDPNGRVYTKIVVTILGESGAFGQPARNLQFLLVTEDGDRTSTRTNDAGVASVWLPPTNYRVVNPDPFIYGDKSYTWDLILPVKPGAAILRLTQANATRVETGALKNAAPSSTVTTDVIAPRTSPQSAASTVNSITQGFFLAPHLLGASLQTDDVDSDGPVESGGGGGLMIGYGFSRVFSVLLNLDVAKIDIVDPEVEGNYALAQFDIGLKFNFRDQTAKGIPYLQAAFTGRAAQTTVDGTEFLISGSGFTFGGGLNYHFQPKAALDIGLTYTTGKFDELKVDGDAYPMDAFNANGARLQLGMIFYPFR